MYSETTNLSNIILVPVKNTNNSLIKVCNYQQCGFCKFGDKCRKISRQIRSYVCARESWESENHQQMSVKDLDSCEFKHRVSQE